MGTDARPADLPDTWTLPELKQYLDSIYLAADSEGLSTGDNPVKKMKLSDLLSSSQVENDSDVSERALTPKGFAASKADAVDYGIVRYSTEQEALDLTPAVALSPFRLNDAIKGIVNDSKINITFDNYADYLTVSGGLNVVTCSLVYTEVGNVCLLSGNIGLFGSGTVDAFTVNFNDFGRIVDNDTAVAVYFLKDGTSGIKCNARLNNIDNFTNRVTVKLFEGASAGTLYINAQFVG